MQTNLYDSNIYFAIQFKDGLLLNQAVYVLEPMNWEKMQNHMPRDPMTFGFSSDFIEDKYGLKFTFITDGKKIGGGQYLKQIYDAHGDQAEVYFSIGYANAQGNPYEEIKSWRVNLEEYELDFGSAIAEFAGVLTSIEKMPFQGKLLARQNTACTINQYLTMDGDLLTPIPVNTLRLHSKSLQESTICQSPSPQTSPAIDPSFFLDSYIIIQPDQSNQIISELSDVFNQPVGILNTGSRLPSISSTPPTPNSSDANGILLSGTINTPSAVYAPPFSDNISQYTPTTSGILEIKWQGGGPQTSFYWYKGTGAGIRNQWWSITPTVVVQRLIQGSWQIVGQYYGTTSILAAFSDSGQNPTAPMVGSWNPSATNCNLASTQYILPGVTGSTPRANIIQCSGYTLNEDFKNISVITGDNVYVHFLLAPNGTTKTPDGGWIQLDGFFNTITYTQLTTTPGSTADGYRIIDVLNQQIECITGQKNAVKSKFFSKGGFGYNYMLTNGYALRNFSALIYQPKKAFSSLFNDLQAIFCLGKGIQEINEVENVVIEYFTDFFKTRIIKRYDNTLEWKEKHNSKFSYNNISLGYNKWQGLNLLMEDEFNTQGSYLTQFLKYGENLLQKMSDLIASGYMIEEQRRNQFNLNPSQSLTEDESWFIIATAEPNIFTGIQSLWGNSNSTVVFYITSLALMPGDQFYYDVPVWFAQGSWVFGAVVSYGSTNYICQNASGNFTSSTPPPTDTFNWVVGGGLNAGTLFTVVSEVTASSTIGQDVYIVTPAPVAEVVGGAYNFNIIPPSPNQVFAERSQPFKICTGVIDPSTIYNGRLSLKHILYNWRPLIAVGLYFVDPLSKDFSVSQIVTTLVKMNSKLTTQFLPTEPNKGNVGDLILNEFSREQISNFVGYEVFSPKQGECKIRAGWNDVEDIRKALCGEHTNPLINFGGVALTDSQGDLWFCHVNDFKYDIFKEMITFDVQKVFLIANSASLSPSVTYVISESGEILVTEGGDIITTG